MKRGIRSLFNSRNKKFYRDESGAGQESVDVYAGTGFGAFLLRDGFEGQP